VTSGAATPTVNPLLTEAYSALAAGNFESSRRLYSQLVISDPGNIEALLGLAAIATQQGDRDTAAKHYVRVIELDPRNSFAQAGLIGMLGRADPRAAETRVKQLIARDPSAAYLHFTLGNTYVDQSRWPDAQQAFFQAYHLQPDHADYAYNLAVALEHVGQPKPALDFYRRAVLLATAKGRANFSTAAAQERVAKLEKIVP
jgi:tetratricopeptide (TPR) repeat protein